MYASVNLEAIKEWPQSRRPLILVPYRNRAAHLAQFLPHMRRILPEAHIWVLEQSDDGRRFNRGALLNAGVKLGIEKGYDHFILHDVDLLPRPALRQYYLAFPKKPIHIGWSWTDKYNYARFFGGIVSLSARDVRRSGGFPNGMWGWGGEDDALRDRILRAGLTILRPDERGPAVMRSLAHEQASGPALNPHKHARDYSTWNMVQFDVLKDTQRTGSNTRYLQLQVK